ncbi:MAG: type II toxin-antitoxin system VapC family toxin [Methylococcales bacterium]
MIITDTNIISEMMKPSPETRVFKWFNEQKTVSLYLTTITIGEIGYGIRALPDGKRRRLLTEGFEALLTVAFESRILDFDEAAARRYGDVMGNRKEMGRPRSSLDGQIIAIARANGCAVATRNIRDFEYGGLMIINPFNK